MNTEIEVKFLHVNHDELREKLTTLGAECKEPMRLMRRVAFDNAAMRAKNGWVRVRDEGNKVTMGYKQTDSYDIDGTKEIETTVGDFEAAVAIFQQIGLDGGSFQESKRESWVLGEVMIELDEWPWLDAFMEIEAPSEGLVRDTAEKLGLDMATALSGDVMVAYREQYPHLGAKDMISKVAEVKFGAPLPELLVGDTITR